MWRGYLDGPGSHRGVAARPYALERMEPFRSRERNSEPQFGYSGVTLQNIAEKSGSVTAKFSFQNP